MMATRNTMRACGAVFALVLTAAPVSGAPITFAFEAEVDSVVGTPDFDSGLNIEPGDRLVGGFTYEPVSLSLPENPLGTQTLTVVQSFRAFFQIDGVDFYTPVSAGLEYRVVNNVRIIDFPGEAFIDTVEVSGSLATQPSGALAGFPGVPSSFAIELWGGAIAPGGCRASRQRECVERFWIPSLALNRTHGQLW